MALDFLGLSSELLTLSLIILGIVLLLLLVFIFLGIQAFALGGTFGSVINSLMPMAAGGGAGGSSKSPDSKPSDINDSVGKT